VVVVELAAITGVAYTRVPTVSTTPISRVRSFITHTVLKYHQDALAKIVA
jgi:hypothetical protein